MATSSLKSPKAKSSSSKSSEGVSLRPSVTLSAEQLAVACLLYAFEVAAPFLGICIISTFKRIFLEEKWFHEATMFLSNDMRRRVSQSLDVVREDMYVITEILIDRADDVFLRNISAPDWEKDECVRLQRLTMEADCVSVMRTRLFHGDDISAPEAHRALSSLERLCRRMSATSEQLQDIQARLEVSMIRAIS